MNEQKSWDWNKPVTFKAEDMLNLALDWVHENKNIVHKYLIWAKDYIEEKRGEGTLTDSEKILFLMVVISYMKTSALRSILLDALETVIGDDDGRD